MMAFAHRPILKKGCYCSISLRTCAITLASFNLLGALVSVASAFFIDFIIIRDPVRTYNDDFDHSHEGPSHSSVKENASSTSSQEPEDFMDFEREGRDVHHWMLITMVFEFLNLLLQCANLIILIVLIVGAAKRRARCIQPWVLLGYVLIAFDILFVIVYIVVGLPFGFTVNSILSCALNTWLWLVSYSLYQECREVERRNTSVPLTMSELEADQHDDRCSVPYAAFSDKLPCEERY